jgi:hypothetical protein
MNRHQHRAEKAKLAKLRAIDERYRQRVRDMRQEMAGPGQRIMVEVMSVRAAVTDERLGASVLDFMAVACAAAFGLVDRRTCFCCDRDWSPDRSPIAILLVSYLDHGKRALVAGLCRDCAMLTTADEPMRAALTRDFGMDPGSCRHIHGAAHA